MLNVLQLASCFNSVNIYENLLIGTRFNGNLQELKIRRQIIPRILDDRFCVRFSRKPSCVCALLSKLLSECKTLGII